MSWVCVNIKLRVGYANSTHDSNTVSGFNSVIYWFWIVFPRSCCWPYCLLVSAGWCRWSCWLWSWRASGSCGSYLNLCCSRVGGPNTSTRSLNCSDDCFQSDRLSICKKYINLGVAINKTGCGLIASLRKLVRKCLLCIFVRVVSYKIICN